MIELPGEILKQIEEAALHWRKNNCKVLLFSVYWAFTEGAKQFYLAGLKENQRKIEALREALEFYANGFDKKLTNSMMGINTPALADGGRLAREALEQTKDE